MKVFSLLRLACIMLFAFFAATAVAMIVPVEHPVYLALAIFSVAVILPKRSVAFSMNGIEAREDFTNVVRIFQNAYNPRYVYNTQTRQWQQNGSYDPYWDAVSAFRLTQQSLRMEQPQVAGQNVYNFPILNNIQNQQQQYNTEIRLAQQDTFVPTHIGFFLEYPSGLNDTTFIPATFPNPFLVTNFVQAQTYYNGWLNIMVNNVQYTTNWDLYRHFKANQTQQTAALGAGSPENQLDGSVDGWYPMQPFVLMIGSQNIKISITLPVAPTNVDANSRLCLWMRGVLGQQSTVVN